MPIYQYRCLLCNHELEALQKITEKPLRTCPRCHKNSLRKVFSGSKATFLFQGKGFYATDYRQGKGSGCGSCESSHSCGNCCHH